MSRTIDDLFKLQETAYKSHTADIAAIRREQTRATINFSRRLDALTGEGLTANDALLALTSKKVNKLVDSAEFMLPVGPGCETEVDFSGKWVALMRSHRLNNKLKLGLSVANMEEINDMGADIDEHTWSLFRTVVLHNAVRVGKGTCAPRRPCARHDPTLPAHFPLQLPRSSTTTKRTTPIATATMRGRRWSTRSRSRS